MKCSVENCYNNKRFRFPSSDVRRKQWLNAIRRPNWKPKKGHGLCEEHFKKSDIITESYMGGYKLEKIHLSSKAVPSIFSWTPKNVKKVINIFEDDEDIESDSHVNSDLSTAVAVDIKESSKPNNEPDKIVIHVNSDLSTVLVVDIKESSMPNNEPDKVVNHVNSGLSTVIVVDIKESSMPNNEPDKVVNHDESLNTSTINDSKSEEHKLQEHTCNKDSTCDENTQPHIPACETIEDLQIDTEALLYFTEMLEDYDRFIIS
ncbi:hypothetical protein TSAR_004813 [Trichomalopsis sarcophagae]|uniref:THAP-type domain-containing protein n=1 Tax=Trichomalopsis sarcophagae TaxID=543379 RepID=A0A232F5T0_9HYME|nr:hypothetical protein TSAR_004813 [Trichomalopsis sarcophagae]